uniref:Uncharacterized protein n=1 Tax=Arundo donax TaxID=35708 RepID=A0A0A9EDV4_ARUDO
MAVVEYRIASTSILAPAAITFHNFTPHSHSLSV